MQNQKSNGNRQDITCQCSISLSTFQVLQGIFVLSVVVPHSNFGMIEMKESGHA